MWLSLRCPFLFIHSLGRGGVERRFSAEIFRNEFSSVPLELKYVWVRPSGVPCALCLAMATSLRRLAHAAFKGVRCGTWHPRLENASKALSVQSGSWRRADLI